MKDDRAYIDHILISIGKILNFCHNISKAEFDNNVMLQDAVIRNIEIIGEATKRISPAMKNEYPDIPWREMAGMRDKLIHDYLGVDIDVIWETVKNDIPQLKSLLEGIF